MRIGGVISSFKVHTLGYSVITEIDLPCSCRGSMNSKCLELYIASNVGNIAPPTQHQLP